MKFLVLLCSVATATAAAVQSRAYSNLTYKYSTLVADSFLKRGVTKTNRYDAAVFYRSVELAYNATQNATYINWVQNQVDGVVAEDGTITGYPAYPFSLDDVRMGTILLDLYVKTGLEKYKLAATTLRAQLNRGPRTPSGGFWHRQPTYPNQMWLDGIFMADVFYAQWTSLFDSSNTTAWDDILLQFTLIEEHTRNTTTNLLYHGYDESGVAVWADPETGASPHVWDRALGWYLMALVDTLDFFPASHPGHAKFVNWLVTAAKGVLDAQDPATGGWWLVMDEPYPGMPGNYIESSGSSMFVYALLKAVRLGYIGAEYIKPMKKGYEYLAETFVAFNGTGGTVNWEGTVVVGSLGSNATYEYYIGVALQENDLKGAGPFIYASVEYEAL